MPILSNMPMYEPRGPALEELVEGRVPKTQMLDFTFTKNFSSNEDVPEIPKYFFSIQQYSEVKKTVTEFIYDVENGGDEKLLDTEFTVEGGLVWHGGENYIQPSYTYKTSDFFVNSKRELTRTTLKHKIGEESTVWLSCPILPYNGDFVHNVFDFALEDSNAESFEAFYEAVEKVADIPFDIPLASFWVLNMENPQNDKPIVDKTDMQESDESVAKPRPIIINNNKKVLATPVRPLREASASINYKTPRAQIIGVVNDNVGGSELTPTPPGFDSRTFRMAQALQLKKEAAAAKQQVATATKEKDDAQTNVTHLTSATADISKASLINAKEGTKNGDFMRKYCDSSQTKIDELQAQLEARDVGTNDAKPAAVAVKATQSKTPAAKTTAAKKKRSTMSNKQRASTADSTKVVEIGCLVEVKNAGPGVGRQFIVGSKTSNGYWNLNGLMTGKYASQLEVIKSKQEVDAEAEEAQASDQE